VPPRTHSAPQDPQCRPGSPAHLRIVGPMSKTVRLVIGVVLILAGVLFGLQGLGAMGGSGGMNGNAFWAVAGPLIAIIGLVLVVRTVRAGSGVR
jgi:hypothetical protein